MKIKKHSFSSCLWTFCLATFCCLGGTCFASLPVYAQTPPRKHNPLSLSTEERLLQTVSDLCQRAAVIYNIAHERKDQPDTADGAQTIALINTIVPKEWTKQKIEQSMNIVPIKDSVLRATLFAYVDQLPLGAQGTVSSEQETKSVQKLQGVARPDLVGVLKMLNPAFNLTREAIIELKKPKIASTSPKGTGLSTAGDHVAAMPISGQAYYDDVDALFDDARSKIESNFDRFSNSLNTTGVSNKLLNTSVDGQDMVGSMRQAAGNTLQQAGASASSVYRPVLTEIQQLRQPPPGSAVKP